LIDLIDEITEDPAIHLTMRFERGDLQLAKNAALLHPRHLVRLWLTARSFDDGAEFLRSGIPKRDGTTCRARHIDGARDQSSRRPRAAIDAARPIAACAIAVLCAALAFERSVSQTVTKKAIPTN
jgi:hypothetical protein